MGKIWMKTRNEAGLSIPHSWNIANAMYGFLELGAEIVPYQKIDDIYASVTRDDIVLDYIRQCNMIFSKFGINPDIPDYPESLKSFLGRSVWKDTIPEILFSGERNLPWNEVEKYISMYSGSSYEVQETGDIIQIGSRFATEYCGSIYTKKLHGTLEKAKANAAQIIPELLINVNFSKKLH